MKVNTDKILREYYLNLFSSSAEITKSGNNNFMYKWNIRDLQLSKNAEIGLLQITNNRATLTDERQYPPKLYNSFTDEETGTGEILNINPTTYIKETITLNTSGITYVIGTYLIYSSGSSNEFGRRKALLFDRSLSGSGTVWGYNTYTQSTGLYTGSSYIKNGYVGEWVIIKLPSPIILLRFIFNIVPSYPQGFPSLWRCYGSNDGSIWEEIEEASNNGTALTSVNYNLNSYEGLCNNNKKSYLYIGFTFNKVVGLTTGSGGSTLVIAELQLFGKEEIKPIYVSSNVLNSTLTNYYTQTQISNISNLNSNYTFIASNNLNLASSMTKESSSNIGSTPRCILTLTSPIAIILTTSLFLKTTIYTMYLYDIFIRHIYTTYLYDIFIRCIYTTFL
jgi:hypothetical protein